MRKYLLSGLLYLFAYACMADTAYMQRFNDYLTWHDQLPEQVSPAFIQFIQQNKPLSKKLREQWLYDLAKKEDWQAFDKYYQASKDRNLQCYAGIAAYHAGRQALALKYAEKLWLSGRSQPKACDALFSLLLADKKDNRALINQRIVLALKQRNLGLAAYLVKKYQKPKLEEVKDLLKTYWNPTQIKTLKDDKLYADFYLYGLKRMVSRNMDKLVHYWKQINKQKQLTDNQKQIILSHIALYKAIRNQDDAYFWFNKVKPAYYTPVLLDWEMRSALKNQKWQRVLKISELHSDKKNKAWQYWRARALGALGQKEKAKAIYQQLSGERNYYGFLSSMRLGKKLQFNSEKIQKDKAILVEYKPFLDQVQHLYENGEKHQASLLLNDFSSELPKKEASALAWWVADTLKWPGKSVYLTNLHKPLYHQLALRFPMAHQKEIEAMAKKHDLPPAFIYAIIRQESAFRAHAVSRVGARGLMQLMPKTAKLISKKKKIPYKDSGSLFEETKNIQLGTAYLDYLSQRFDKRLLLMAAAYNAGPSQVNYWLKNHAAKDIDVWIDSLPWHETRNYLKNVIAFYLVYQYRLDKKPDMQPFLKTF